MRGLLNHFLLTLRLNFRSWQPMVYGYAVPVFFLLAFGSVFRSGDPPLLREMGQLLVISTLGGACFGMPTALVAERERGVWRRYALLPVPMSRLVLSVMLARVVIVSSAAVLQILLAWLIYDTPMPVHPWQLAIAYGFVCFALLGLGLIIASLADNVPAVQALGQMIFLPMIMVGGVGIPLRLLPLWARRVAGFLPGRYAVESLQACINADGLSLVIFSLGALMVIGIAAFVAGAKMFRWDAQKKLPGREYGWVAVALLAWAGVGLAAEKSGRNATPPAQVLSDRDSVITDQMIQSIAYDDLPDDRDTVTPFTEDTSRLDAEQRLRLRRITEALAQWPPGQVSPVNQAVRNLLSVAAIADVQQDPLEGRIAAAVFTRMNSTIPRGQLIQTLVRIALRPQEGTVITTAPELDVEGPIIEATVRERCQMNARKFLGRVLGKWPRGPRPLEK